MLPKNTQSKIKRNHLKINKKKYKQNSSRKLTCSTRFGRPVFCDSCLRSFASGL